MCVCRIFLFHPAVRQPDKIETEIEKEKTGPTKIVWLIYERRVHWADTRTNLVKPKWCDKQLAKLIVDVINLIFPFSLHSN